MYILFIGVALVLYSEYLFRKTRKFKEEAVEIEARVVEIIEEFNIRSTRTFDKYLYYPVLEFEDLYGKQIRRKLNQGSSPPSYILNQKVKILYKPDEPENMTTPTNIYLPAYLVLSMGLICLVGGLLGYIENYIQF
ncbi:MAG: DUF3592 domain-containing protein [Candidatus Kapaibacterium sp.]|jgi:hypothetical protein|nr:DUF3592 domain-containing protein [Candidatus Kapabacteria bacterium]